MVLPTLGILNLDIWWLSWIPGLTQNLFESIFRTLNKKGEESQPVGGSSTAESTLLESGLYEDEKKGEQIHPTYDPAPIHSTL